MAIISVRRERVKRFSFGVLGLSLLLATSEAWGTTSNQTFETAGGSLNIDGSGTTHTFTGFPTVSNSISTYSVTNNYAFVGAGLITFNLGTGGTLSTLLQNYNLDAAVEFSNCNEVSLSGGAISETGTVPEPYGNGEAMESFQSNVSLTGTTITQNVSGPAVNIDQGSLTMTGGEINGYEGTDLTLGADGTTTFTLAGGVLGGNAPDQSFPTVAVNPGSILNLFGSNFTMNGVALTDGTYAEQAPETFPTPTYLEIQGTLLSGQRTDFGVTGYFEGGPFTLNVNVGTPPAVPEPVDMGLALLVGTGALHRRCR